ncbi:Blue-light-activated protein [Gemmata sp. SH-PL17]|uniref:PAS domain-containing protein n=1 Tax=Gemmata sp. SH-PL17 TaxID=1630693 RepID=UPI0004B56186|nr:PAS domain-containing protein [Gemmata sp. SH-PL17]AMV24411.1 Blue-light-activated protein [Gemmata sp. SH-PL17]
MFTFVKALETLAPPPRASRLLRLTAMKFPLLPQAAETMALGMVISDATRPDYPIVYCNPGFERLTGYTSDEVVGRNCRFLQGPGTDTQELERLRRSLREHAGCSVVLRNYRKDRTPFWNALSVTPLEDETGTVTHFVGVQTDITHVKELEAQFLQAQKMGVVGRLTGGVAHDFNNLLTVINGFAEAVLDLLPPDNPTRDMVAEIAAAGSRAAGLTRQLLTLSRKGGARRAHADLNAVVNSCSGILRRLLGSGVELRAELAPDLHPTTADPGHVEQVLINLVVNARDAMPNGGALTVSTADAHVKSDDPQHPRIPAGMYAVLRVADTGHGMDPATLKRIFEPYFTTKPAGRGTGLGLSTVWDIVQKSQGHVCVDSELGRGTEFRVYLPRVDALPFEPLPDSSGEHRLRGSETVLIVDSDTSVRALMTHALRSRGYTVLAASDPQEATALVSDHPGTIDLVVCDLVLSGESGNALARRLRVARPDLALLLTSGCVGEGCEIPDAAAPFLPKPFTPAGLATEVRKVLDRG